jgi:hypothetical protein
MLLRHVGRLVAQMLFAWAASIHHLGEKPAPTDVVARRLIGPPSAGDGYQREIESAFLGRLQISRRVGERSSDESSRQ